MTVFSGCLKLAARRFELKVPVGQSRLANGQLIPSSLGASYWRGSGLFPAQRHVDTGYEVDLMALMRPGQTFQVFDARFNGPRLDPGGAGLTGLTPTIHTLDADNRRLRVTGLPAGYELRRGDYIGWAYGASPVRHALHRLAGDTTASAGGLTPLFAVEPHIRPGSIVGADVILVRPTCKAIMVASDFGASELVSDGASFEWQETLR